MENKFVFGIDYGTESARAILVNVVSGKVVSSAVSSYPNGVITNVLPNTKIKLGTAWALQDPMDYIKTLKDIITFCLIDSKVNNESVIGIGIDFTASTILPISKEGNPLCFDSEFKENPHSWVKLWKHHAAYRESDIINKLAKESNESFLKRYGGEVSEEWMLPKILQIVNEAPEVYSAADQFIEAGDWLVMQLVGSQKRSSCMAGYKGTWSKGEGYPNKDFLKRLHPNLEHVVEEKLTNNIYPIGSRAGYLTKKMANELGLTEDVAVAVGIIDAHAAFLGAGVNRPGKMVMAMGTSICHLCIDDKEVFVPGISGVVEDGIIPGYFAYESGQSAGGDSLAWFVKNGVPEHLYRYAKDKDLSIYQLLEEEASKIYPGEHGLVALDWWNGNRSILKDANLTGTLVGLRLDTKAVDIYRALLESLAFGTKKILRAYEENGVNIDELYAVGGLADKNKLLMQLYADITGKNVSVVTIPYACAMGAAILGSVAAGKEKGGWGTIEEAVQHLVHYEQEVYQPIYENSKIYNQVFEVYETLYEYLGDDSSPMKKLLHIQRNTNETESMLKEV